ncbi:MAG: transporter [Proteobacteria bacterium]|jgi:MFS transporter, CP family, cyanate transporter|nr:transporter [Pseudomonadota bacterium]
MTASAGRSLRAPVIVVLAGVCAALHVGKLPPAITALQAALGLSLLQAGFLLSTMQVAGMSAGVAFGALADALGFKRSMLLGLGLLALASAAGGLAQDVTSLLLLRVVEGFGFLLVVLPAPGLIRRLVAPERLSRMLGLWGTYMPFGAALALLIGPVWIGAFGWRAWWWVLGGLSLAMALWLARAVPAADATAAMAPTLPWSERLRQTLASPGPWLVATTFAVYAGQWLAVIGFLPAIYLEAGVSGAATGVLTALAAAVNMAGNLASGRLLHAGVRPTRLLATGFVTMGLTSAAAFAAVDAATLPPALRYAAILVFSMVGGLIPATLFSLAVRLAPSEQTLSSTVGWMQQWSALGQFAGPPLVAWVASRSGGWQWTWVATGACSLLGLLLAARIAALLRARTHAPMPDNR